MITGSRKFGDYSHFSSRKKRNVAKATALVAMSSPIHGRDIFSLISGQAWLFWRNTGKTLGSFSRLALDLLDALSSLTAGGQPRISQCRQKITLINQVLLTIIWLWKYPHVDTLSLWFDIDPSSVVRIVYKVLRELWHYFQNQISWPTLPEWRKVV